MYNLFRLNFTRFLTGIVAAAAAIVLTMSAQAGGSTVSVGSNSISASANVSGASSIEIRVGGPGGYRASQQSDTGVVTWDAPAGLADGAYRYEVFVTTGTAGSDEGGAGDARLHRENGRFTAEGGVLSPLVDQSPNAAADTVQPPSLLARIAKGVIDFIIPSANAIDYTASSINPTFFYDDTDVAGIEWRTEGNTLFWGVSDITNSNFVFWAFNSTNNLNSVSVQANGDMGLSNGIVDIYKATGDVNLANNTMYIDAAANFVGIGTVTPSDELHIATASPAIRFDSGSVDYLFINGGDDFVFSIATNSGSNPIGNILTLENTIGSNWKPGLGIWESDPEVPLHVRGYDYMSAGILAENTIAPTAAGDVTMFELRNTGNKIVRFKVNAGGANSIWTFDNDPNYAAAAGINSGRFRISKSGTGVTEFFVDGFGNAYATSHVNTSSRETKTDFLALSESDVLTKLMQLEVSEWRYKQEAKDTRHIGPVAEDFQKVFGLGDGKHISTVDTAGVTMAAIQGLYKVVQAKDAELSKLKEENKSLAERLKVLEELVLKKEVASLSNY